MSHNIMNQANVWAMDISENFEFKDITVSLQIKNFFRLSQSSCLNQPDLTKNNVVNVGNEDENRETLYVL